MAKEIIKNENIPTETVKEKPVSKPVKARKPKVGVVANCEYLNVREGAGTQFGIAKVLHAGDKVDILAEEKDFYKINNGFVMKQFIEV